LNSLINVNEAGKTTSRELYEFLGLDSKNYSRWCKSNITDNQFAIEESDYFPFLINEECGGQASINHYLSIDFAKKLCMVSKSERGEQARNYFIEIEKQFSNITNGVKQIRSKQIIPRIKPAIKDALDTAEYLTKKLGIKIGIAQSVCIAMVEKTTGLELEPIKKLLPPAEHDTGFLNATEIGKRINLSAIKANALLVDKGLQAKIDNTWRLTDEGKSYGEEIPYTRNGHSGYQVQWNESVLSVLQ
jgi:phage anti-repressor protein